MSTREAAIQLAGLGWKVIPIFWVEGDHRTKQYACGCGNPYCTAPGKHPLLKMGKDLANATSDIQQVTDWWDTWPQANVAVACGSRSGILVVDCDNKNSEHGGAFEFEAWCAGQGIEVPQTMTAASGGGGVHYIFSYPTDGIPVKNCVGWLPDVDVKSDGGYILVSPSVHISGGAYEWKTSVAAAPIPKEVVNSIRLSKSGSAVRKRRSGVPEDDSEIGDERAYNYREAVEGGARKGYRDDAFNSYAYQLRKMDKSWEDAVSLLHGMWEKTEGVNDPTDPYPWETVLEKATRIWADESIQPEPEDNTKLGWWTAVIDGETIRMQPAPKAIIDGRPQDICTDLGNSWTMLTTFHDSLRWSNSVGWMIWSGTHWVRDENEKLMEFARLTVGHVYKSQVDYEEEKRDKIAHWAGMSSSSQRLTAMIKVASSYDMHKANLEDFDTDPWLLTTPSGTLDLRTGELMRPRREDLITKISRVPYEPDAVDPMWTTYLHEATNGDTDLESYLQRAAGYTLTGLTTEEAMFILYGPKASGKSTFVDAITTLLGDYAGSTQPENLMHRTNKSIPGNEIARMRGMRLITSVEPEHGDRFAAGLLKQMTGGDKMSGRFLYKDTFEFKPTHKLWIATNTKPRAGDEALFRRLKLLLFPVTVPFERRNNWLKIAANDPTSALTKAAFAWAVRGCLEWQRSGLGTAEVVERETSAYQEEEDTMGQFINESMKVTTSAADEVKCKEGYGVYEQWARDRGERPMTYQSFNKAMEEKGIRRTIGKDRQKAFVGIVLTTSVWTGDV